MSSLRASSLALLAIVALASPGTAQTNQQPDRQRGTGSRADFQVHFERWRAAIEHYVPSVTPTNQSAIGSAALPFATYLVAMHRRIHPIFADAFLASVERLPASNVLNDPRLVTRLEIVLSSDGRIVKMGVVKPSGSTAFDVATLESVQRASPFGPPPPSLLSSDGRVYLQWDFHRDDTLACSTANVRPFILDLTHP